jgi:hypothetical protein
MSGSLEGRGLSLGRRPWLAIDEPDPDLLRVNLEGRSRRKRMSCFA